MKKEERIIVYIDGSNLYFKLKNLYISHTSQFNYRGLAKYLTKNRILTDINYYVGAVQLNQHNKKTKKIHQGQLTLFNTLLDKNIKLHKGYLMKNNGVYHEKGVDVNIAVDILVGAYENLYDTALLLSSDTDLIPAIQKIKSLGKKLLYIGFKHAPSIALINHCTYFRLLSKQEILTFTKKDTS
jgi:uncharacterized LabA/DUF88 family protein